MNRYFQCNANAYESTRLALDSAVPMPQNETVYEPLATAPKTSNGGVLIAIRTEHCQVEPYKSAVESMLASGGATEITQAQYEAAIPQPAAAFGEPSVTFEQASAEAVAGLQS